MIGGFLIIVAFLLLSLCTYRELKEERSKRFAKSDDRSDTDD